MEENVAVGVNYVSYEKYQEWCINKNYLDEENQKALLRTLNRIGSIVFFDRPILDQLQILNPEWITTGVYAILTSGLTEKREGRISLEDLKEIFKDEKIIFSNEIIRIRYTENQFQFIIKLMLEYNLCQEDPNYPDKFLIPAAFKGKNDNNFAYHKNGCREYRVQFDAPFEMLIMHRFIAKNIKKAVGNDYWQSGIFIKDQSSDTYALVETNLYSYRIEFWIKGNDIRGFWEALRRDIREICSLYKRFEYKEEVLYKKDEDHFFLPYQEMLDSLRNNILVIQYHPTYKLKNINVLAVIDLFEDAGSTQRAVERENIMDKSINIEIKNSPIINQSSQNTNVTNINIGVKIDVIQTKEFEEIKELLLDLKDGDLKDQEWQHTLVKCLDEFNRLEDAQDKAAQKTSLSLIKRWFKKLKDIKDVVAISVLPVDVTQKFPKLLDLWSTFQQHFS